MRQAILALLCAVAAGAASAEVYPAFHDVAGVAADDVLNVRAAPDAAAPIVGALAPGQADVEVVRLSDDGGWGLVNAGEAAGWAAMRFLARQPGQDWDGLPSALACFGTEPFWGLEIGADGRATLTTPADPPAGYEIAARLSASARPGAWAITAGSGSGSLTAFIAREACTDGMSDQQFGFAISFVQGAAWGQTLFAGCCRLAR